MHSSLPSFTLFSVIPVGNKIFATWLSQKVQDNSNKSTAILSDGGFLLTLENRYTLMIKKTFKGMKIKSYLSRIVFVWSLSMSEFKHLDWEMQLQARNKKFIDINSNYYQHVKWKLKPQRWNQKTLLKTARRKICRWSLFSFNKKKTLLSTQVNH